jgi:hypothetical protein
VIWLSPALITLHNAEEALTLDRALHRLPTLLPGTVAGFAARLTYPTMLVSLGVVSLLAFAVALIADRNPNAPRSLWLVLVLQATMGLNAISHLLLATVLFRGYAPGLVTALLVNAPFAAYCLRRGRQEMWVSRRAFLALFPAAVVVHGPLLVGGLWLASQLP